MHQDGACAAYDAVHSNPSKLLREAKMDAVIQNGILHRFESCGTIKSVDLVRREEFTHCRRCHDPPPLIGRLVEGSGPMELNVRSCRVVLEQHQEVVKSGFVAATDKVIARYQARRRRLVAIQEKTRHNNEIFTMNVL